jgi:predicted  nucleic acid-binding Zn-ribbon protein
VTPDTVVLRFINKELENHLDSRKESLRGFQENIDTVKLNILAEKERYEKDRVNLKDKLSQMREIYDKYKNEEVKGKIKSLNDAVLTAQDNIDKKKKTLRELREKLVAIDDPEERNKTKIEIRNAENKLEGNLADQLRVARKNKFKFRRFDFPREESRKLKAVSDARKAINERLESHHLKIENYEQRINRIQERIAYRKNRINSYEKLLSKLELKAGVNGMVIYGDPDLIDDNLEIKVGKQYWSGQTLLTIPAVSDMFVMVKIDEERRPLYKIGTEAVGTIDALPDVTLEGKVVRIGNLAMPKFENDPNSPRIFPVQILFPMEQEGIKKVISGMTIRVLLICRKLKNVLHIPVHAVYEKQGQIFTRVRNGSGFQERKISISDFNEESVVIEKGLREGEEILLFDPTFFESS